MPTQSLNIMNTVPASNSSYHCGGGVTVDNIFRVIMRFLPVRKIDVGSKTHIDYSRSVHLTSFVYSVSWIND